MKNDIVELFEQIDPLPDNSSLDFHAVTLDQRAQVRLARDKDGRAAFLIEMRSAGTGYVGDERLEHISVHHNVSIRVGRSGGAGSELRSSVVRCLSDDLDIRSLFLVSLAQLLPSQDGELTAQQITKILEGLHDLFSAALLPQTKPVMGLWAELFVLCLSSDASRMTRAWHANGAERYDFAEGDQRVEVKASTGGARRHHMSLEQANPPERSQVIVASVLLEPLAGGRSLGQLWDQALDQVRSEPDLPTKVQRLCIAALGASWAVSREEAFDFERAQESLKLYDIATIPRISRPVCPGVSSVRFVSDLTFVDPIDMADIPAGSLASTLIVERS